MRGRITRLLSGLVNGPSTVPVELVDLDRGRTAAAEHALLRQIAAEAVILQDDADAVLAKARARLPLGQVAPVAGPLVHRFFRLRDRLPKHCSDPADDDLRACMDVILHHHAVLVATALDLLAYEWRSEQVASTVESLRLGDTAQRLEQVYAELARS